MRLERTNDGSLFLSEMPKALADFLAKIPMTIDLDALSPEAHERFFPVPSTAAGDQAAEEWKAFVEPELKARFSSARDLVTQDLKSIDTNGKKSTLRIPPDHAEAWLIALNQARLVIGARFGYDENMLSGRGKLDPRTPEGLDLVRANFYAFLQANLLACMDESDN